MEVNKIKGAQEGAGKGQKICLDDEPGEAIVG